MLEFAFIALVALAVAAFVLVEYGKSLQETEQAKQEAKETEDAAKTMEAAHRNRPITVDDAIDRL